jgi:4-deoxy-L-threo-5-hexosulose-uronate ketol-isomerase
MNTDELRRAFVLGDLFESGRIKLGHTSIDRAVVGTAVPNDGRLALEVPAELASEYFTERRELGIINIGQVGSVRVDGRDYRLGHRDALYVGRGNRQIEFGSFNPGTPALFYFVSYPAHASHPVRQICAGETESESLGSRAMANRRTINRYIRPPAVESCQLTMGLTELEGGSVWNTMPAHTHFRRSEIYLYFDLPEEAVVCHLMGEPGETRHVVVRNRQAVLSPGWSIHCGAGTSSYSFIWAMGGENREFADTDAVPMSKLA